MTGPWPWPAGSTLSDVVRSTDRDALRDQFALHAPPVPDWYEVPMTASTKPMTPGAVERWKVQRAINRLTQWPWHYADLVLAERDVVQARGEQR